MWQQWQKKRESEWGLERNNQNVSSNYYLWVVGFGGFNFLNR